MEILFLALFCFRHCEVYGEQTAPPERFKQTLQSVPDTVHSRQGYYPKNNSTETSPQSTVPQKAFLSIPDLGSWTPHRPHSNGCHTTVPSNPVNIQSGSRITSTPTITHHCGSSRIHVIPAMDTWDFLFTPNIFSLLSPCCADLSLSILGLAHAMPIPATFLSPPFSSSLFVFLGAHTAFHLCVLALSVHPRTLFLSKPTYTLSTLLFIINNH